MLDLSYKEYESSPFRQKGGKHLQRFKYGLWSSVKQMAQ